VSTEQTETSVNATVSITNLTRNETNAALDGLPVGGRLQAERKPVKVGGRRYDVHASGIGTAGAQDVVGAVRAHMDTTAADMTADTQATIDALNHRCATLVDQADAAEERARLAERDARAEHAEVERLRGTVDEAISLAYWLAEQMGEHVDDQGDETCCRSGRRYSPSWRPPTATRWVL
jgi:hypothetical protein